MNVHESRGRLSSLRKRRGQYQQLDISPPYGPVIKLNCHSIGRIDRAFVPTFRPDMPRPVHPGSRGLAEFIDKIEIPSILRDKYGTGLASCASLYALKLTREIEHLPWRGRRSLRDDNRRNNPLHRPCRRHVIIEWSRRAGCGDAVDGRAMTCHDLLAHNRPHHLHCLDGLDRLHRLENSCRYRDQRHWCN